VVVTSPGSSGASPQASGDSRRAGYGRRLVWRR
jgi:hypothetical protein